MLCGRDLIYYYFSRFSPDTSIHFFTSLPCPTDLKCYLDCVLNDYLYLDLFLCFLFCCVDRPVYFRALTSSVLERQCVFLYLEGAVLPCPLNSFFFFF